MLSFVKDLSIGAWVALSVIVASCAAIVIFAPPHFWEILGAADWPHVAGVIALVLTSIVGVFVKARKDAGPLLALLGALALGATLTGCGSSPVGTQYQMLRVATSLFDTATEGAEAALTVQAQACDHDDVCLDATQARWLPVRAAQSAVLVLLQGWAGVIQLWEATGDFASLARAAIRQVRDIGRAWNAWASASTAAGWLSLPPLPPEVLTFATALGGAE